jgi:hypothetical protein
MKNQRNIFAPKRTQIRRSFAENALSSGDYTFHQEIDATTGMGFALIKGQRQYTWRCLLMVKGPSGGGLGGAHLHIFRTHYSG